MINEINQIKETTYSMVLLYAIEMEQNCEDRKHQCFLGVGVGAGT